MGGDYTRLTYQPHKRYDAVLMQQGRVQLDADWNEQIGILRRRWQLQAEDTFGSCAVPRATTPNGFALAAVAGPPADLAIAPGRMYVDGMLAEVLPDESFSYLSQPYYPAPPDFAAIGGPNGLALLDVWQREVTYVEDVDLLEKALGGPDTTARLQTVWQLKIAGTGETDATCAVDFGALFPPSAGRLNTRGQAAPSTDDPCIIPPGAGFRGLENRLYRVEIHTPGDITTARFKWSRDNASIVSSVESIGASGSASQLTVSRIGRDPILRFEIDDWVEVVDDVRELMGEPGEMAQVTAIDEASRTLTLDRSIPAAGGRAFGANGDELRTRHTRVIRWDQRSGVDANGLLAVGAAWLALEDGVQIRFALAPAGGAFVLRDYWNFAARTVDGSVEQLVDAPPRGIRHHYCAVATLTGLAAGENPAVQSDCRTLWPPGGGGCCCTDFTVGDGVRSTGDFSDIQAAVYAATAGGTISILEGDYALKAPVRVEAKHLVIRGCGPATRIRASGFDAAFVLRDSDDVVLESLTIEASSPFGAVLVEVSNGVTVRDCTVVNAGDSETVDTIAALRASGGRGPAVNVLDSTLFTAENNLLVGLPSVAVQALTAALRRNTCAGGGIWVIDGSADVTVAGNEIIGGQGPGVGLGGVANSFELSPRAAGILNVAITGNRILGMSEAGVATLAPAADRLGGQRPVQIERFAGGLIDVDGLLIANNEVVACAHAWPNVFSFAAATGGVVLDTAARVRIRDNAILDNGSPEADSAALVKDTLTMLERVNPAIPRLAVDLGQPSNACGIFVHNCIGLEVTGNTIAGNGSPRPLGDTPGYQAGIAALFVVGDDAAAGETPTQTSAPAAAIRGNTVITPAGQALLVAALGPVAVTDNALVTREVYDQPQALLQLGVFLEYGMAIFILDLGRTPVLSDGTSLGVTTTFHVANPAAAESPILGTAAIARIAFPDGRVLFDDNQVTFSAAATEERLLHGAIAVLSLDDVSLQQNQVLSEPARSLFFDTIVAAPSVRVAGNRFTELPGRAAISCYSWGQLNVTTGNQATHCIVAAGGQVIDANNQSLITTFCERLNQRMVNQ